MKYLSLPRYFVTLFLCYFVTFTTWAQPVEGTGYYLPQTAMRFTMLVEKSVYEPGELAPYAQRYMKLNDIRQEAATEYRIVDIQMNTFAVPDSSKHYTISLDKRYSVSDVRCADNGILLAVNAEPRELPQQTHFRPGTKVKPLNPKDYMNEDILTAGSTAKMAQLTAQEIYDIRDSRNQLQRGQAEFMPKDGQQLRIMMDGLDTQEHALRQVFEGTTVCDTTEVTVEFIPTAPVESQLLFRFSRHFGLVDADDLSGVPYFVKVEGTLPAEPEVDKKKEKMKDDIGLWVNKPGKVTVTLSCNSQPLKKYDFFAGQFGPMENLSGALFGKKLTSKVVLSPITGGLESIKEEALEK